MQHPAGQSGLDLSAQMYQSPSSLAAQQYHVRQGHHHQQQQQQRQRQQQQQQQQQQQAHPGVGREIDEMMTDAGFSRNWDMFNANFKPM